MLCVYLLPTTRVDRYLVRSAAWSAVALRWVWLTRTDRVERVILAGSARARAAGPAILPARPLERLGQTGYPLAVTGAARRHGLLPLTALPCACPSLPGVSARFQIRARATNKRETAGGNSLAARGRFQRARLRAEVPRLPPARCLPYLPR